MTLNTFESASALIDNGRPVEKDRDLLQVARDYASRGERPIPLCDPCHEHASISHVQGYMRADGSAAPPCTSPGKAPYEKNYGRFAAVVPTESDLHRMFDSHIGNIGGVVPEGRIAIDIDPRSGGLESIEAYIREHGTIPWTPTVLTGGEGFHYYLKLPDGVSVPSGGSLAKLGYPGIEWKGPGAQVVVPPSIHPSGKPYRWEPGCGLGEVTIAPIPASLLQMILESSTKTRKATSSRNSHADSPFDVQPTDVQRHFAHLWLTVGLDIREHSGSYVYICPFHDDGSPSLHLDAQRCIWYCFSPECVAFGGGGVRQLEALVEFERSDSTPRPLSHRGESNSDTSASALGKESYPDGDDDLATLREQLKEQARELFPVPHGVRPRVMVRLYASVRVPNLAMRHQVISNTWDNEANRAIKRRVYYAHLMQKIIEDRNDDPAILYEVVVPSYQWSDRKRSALAAQVRRRDGQYACFDNRTVAGVVRFLTNVSIPGSTTIEDMETTLVGALSNLDMPDETERKARVHLIWLSKGWTLPAHEPKGTMKLIAFKKDVEPVDDDQEAAEAEAQGIRTWLGRELLLEEWRCLRFFAVSNERVNEIGKEGAFEELLNLAKALGYWIVKDPVERVFGDARPEEDERTGPPARGPIEPHMKGEG